MVSEYDHERKTFGDRAILVGQGRREPCLCPSRVPGRLYDQLFEDRQEGDYVVFISFEPEYVESQLTQCSQFQEQLRSLITSVSE